MRKRLDLSLTAPVVPTVPEALHAAVLWWSSCRCLRSKWTSGLRIAPIMYPSLINIAGRVSTSFVQTEGRAGKRQSIFGCSFGLGLCGRFL